MDLDVRYTFNMDLCLYKSIEGHNSGKMLNRVASSWKYIGIMLLNMCVKFQNNILMDFEDI